MAMKRTPEIEAAMRAAGIPISPPPSALLPPGTLVVEFDVPGRPVPWKAPHTTRTGHSFKDKSLVAWQKTVAQFAALAMIGRRPYEGAVRLSVAFYLTPRGGSPPDTSNLTKALEDALQGTVVVNDRRVVAIESQRFLQPHEDCARIRVVAAEDQ